MRHSIEPLCLGLLGASLNTPALGQPGVAFARTEIDESGKAIRYTSDLTVYKEALVNGVWAGRFWSTNGRSELAYSGLTDHPSFSLAFDGEALPDDWSVSEIVGQPVGSKGARNMIVRLESKRRPIDVSVYTSLDGTAVMTRWLEITNRSDKPIRLTAVYPWSAMIVGATNYWGNTNPPKTPRNAFTLGSFTRGDHCWEGWFDWRTLPVGPTVIGCDRGQCYDDPFFIIRNETTGEYVIGSLAWSANWRMELDYSNDGSNILTYRIGPWSTDALRVIAPGETVTTPAVHMGMVAGDLDSAVQAMHDHVRQSVLPKRPARRSWLVQYSLPGDQGYLSERFGDPSGYTEESVTKNIDLAASLGAELFIMDAAWWEVQGDWTESPTRFPRGLAPLADYCHKKGMLFGLYAEVEKASGGSAVAKAHPEWVAWHAPYPIIDLANPEAAAWMEEQLCGLIDRYKLDLFRLDFNTPTEERFEGKSFTRDGFPENNFWRYYDACYAIFDQLHAKYPDLILQQAACGGARNDLGFVAHFHEQYLTDGLRLPYEAMNYCGQTLSLPPETIAIAHGADGGQGIGCAENLDTVLRLTFTTSTPWLFAGSIGASESDIHPIRTARIRRYCELYKSFIRPILPKCRVYHHAPVSATGGVESGDWYAMEYADPNRTQGWATIMRIATNDESDRYRIIPRGLDPAKTYEVTFDSIGSTTTIDGLKLTQDGLSVRLESIGASELLLFKAR